MTSKTRKTHTIRNPGYNKFNEYEKIPHEEATRVRIRSEFKNKLKSLTVKHNPNQEYCCDCATLPPTPVNAPSIVSIRRTSTTGTMGPKPKVSHRSTGGSMEVRTYGVSSESAEYLKAHPAIKSLSMNPERIPHDEIGNIMAAFTNLHLAHEIAINRCYRLKNIDENVVPGPNAETQSKIQEVLWELLEEEVQKKSGYRQTLVMVEDLKNALISLMMPHNHELREQVTQVLNQERLSEEVKKIPFDYECYLPYVLDVLAQICCPSRDAQVEAARKMKKPVDKFKAIYKLVENMKIDMENFFINLYRPSIVRGTIENERKKFADFLELEYRLHEDGLRATRSWLIRHNVGVRDSTTVIARAYGEILCWNLQEPWPETLLEDLGRFQKLRKTLERIGIVGGVVMELGKACHKIFKNPPPKLRQIFSRYMKILIPQQETTDPGKLKACLETAAGKAVEATEQITSKYLQRSLTADETKLIYDSVVSVVDPEHSFRNLIIRRTIDHAEEVILAAKDYHTPVPSTLSPIMYEVAVLVNEFHRVVIHNRSCFDELYRDIIEGRNKVPKYPNENDWNWDLGLLDTLKKLRSRMTPLEEARMLEKIASEPQGDTTIIPSDEDDTMVVEFISANAETKVPKAPPQNPFSLRGSNQEEPEPPLRKPKFNLTTKSFDYFKGSLPFDSETSEEEEKATEVIRNNKELCESEAKAFRKFCTECLCVDDTLD